MRVIKHIQYYSSFVLSTRSVIKRGRGGTLTREGGAYFKLWPIGGALIRGEALIRGFTVLSLGFAVTTFGERLINQIVTGSSCYERNRINSSVHSPQQIFQASLALNYRV